MDHILIMTTSSSTIPAMTAGHLQEECQHQEGTMPSLYFPTLKIYAAPKS